MAIKGCQSNKKWKNLISLSTISTFRWNLLIVSLNSLSQINVYIAYVDPKDAFFSVPMYNRAMA